MKTLLSVHLALTSLAWSDDWPQYLGPTRNGVYTGTPLSTQWGTSGPKALWKRDIGEGFSGPVIAAGKVIAFHYQNGQDIVDCLDLNSGRPVWSFKYDSAYRDGFGFNNGPRATPAIANGRVYTFGAQGILHCLDFNTGKKLWRVDTHEKFGADKGFFGAACSPIVENDLVLVNVGGRNGAGIVAFDARTGAVKWTADDHEASYSSPVITTIRAERHAFFFTRNGLVDLNPATGSIRWQFRWRPRINASVNAAAPLVDGDVVFVSTSYNTGAKTVRVTADGYQEMWTGDDSMSNHYSTCVIHQGKLYGFDGRQEYGAHLRCVDLKTGEVHWSKDRFGSGTLMLASGNLLILDERGTLTLARATPTAFMPLTQGSILSGKVRPHPALSAARLVARGENELVCVDLRK